MRIVKKIDISEDILQQLKNIARKKVKRIIIFDNYIYNEMLKIRPEEKEQENIIFIKKTKIINIKEKDFIYIGYDSLNESFVISCKKIYNNLYLLKGVRYKNKIYNIDDNYYINNFFEFIIKLMLKNNSI